MIVRTEVTSLKNTAKEIAYKEADEEGEYKFQWISIPDNRRTEICKTITQRTANGVSMKQLKKIIDEERDKNIQKRDWLPHIGCRSTFSRMV